MFNAIITFCQNNANSTLMQNLLVETILIGWDGLWTRIRNVIYTNIYKFHDYVLYCNWSPPIFIKSSFFLFTILYILEILLDNSLELFHIYVIIYNGFNNDSHNAVTFYPYCLVLVGSRNLFEHDLISN